MVHSTPIANPNGFGSFARIVLRGETYVIPSGLVRFPPEPNPCVQDALMYTSGLMRVPTEVIYFIITFVQAYDLVPLWRDKYALLVDY